MSQTVVNDLPSFLQHASRDMKDAALAALLAERATATHGKPLSVAGVGVFVPYPLPPGPPPVLSPERQAELAHRLDNLDDTLTHDELMAKFGEPSAPPGPGHR